MNFYTHGWKELFSETLEKEDFFLIIKDLIQAILNYGGKKPDGSDRIVPPISTMMIAINSFWDLWTDERAWKGYYPEFSNVSEYMQALNLPAKNDVNRPSLYFLYQATLPDLRAKLFLQSFYFPLFSFLRSISSFNENVFSSRYIFYLAFAIFRTKGTRASILLFQELMNVIFNNHVFNVSFVGISSSQTTEIQGFWRTESIGGFGRAYEAYGLNNLNLVFYELVDSNNRPFLEYAYEGFPGALDLYFQPLPEYGNNAYQIEVKPGKVAFFVNVFVVFPQNFTSFFNNFANFVSQNLLSPETKVEFYRDIYIKEIKPIKMRTRSSSVSITVQSVS